jgi:hypothetical protein
MTSCAGARACRAAASRSSLGMLCEVLRVVRVLNSNHVGVDVMLIDSGRTFWSQKMSALVDVGHCGGDKGVLKGEKRRRGRDEESKMVLGEAS